MHYIGDCVLLAGVKIVLLLSQHVQPMTTITAPPSAVIGPVTACDDYHPSTSKIHKGS